MADGQSGPWIGSHGSGRCPAEMQAASSKGGTTISHDLTHFIGGGWPEAALDGAVWQALGETFASS